MNITRMRRLAVLGASALLAGAATVASAPSAEAVSVYEGAAVCGAGYSFVAHQALELGVAWIQLTRNSATGEYCVSVYRTDSKLGVVAYPMQAYLLARGASAAKVNAGSFKYYAGPVYVKATCVVWGGKFNSASYYSAWTGSGC